MSKLESNITALAKLGDGENNSIYDQIHTLNFLKLPERYHYTAFFTKSCLIKAVFLFLHSDIMNSFIYY